MPDDFPKIDLTAKKDLDSLLTQIKRHATKIVREDLTQSAQTTATATGGDRKTVKACEEALSTWVKSAKHRLEPNVTVNGVGYKQSSASDGAEPFDQALSQRVQRLSERADTLTAEAIAARKTLPAQRAALVQARMEALAQIGKANEKKRRATEEALDRALGADTSSSGESFKVDRSHEAGSSLRTTVDEIDRLALSLIEQTSAAHEQANFVKRIRLMSASSS